MLKVERILKQTHDKKLAESFEPIIKKLTKTFRRPNAEDGNPQTPSIQNVTGTQPLRDTLTLKNRSDNFFKLVEKANGDVVWIGLHI